MGCGQSKIENEETVTRCKERKEHMGRSVTARNKFAAAHVANAVSLKNTGAALSDFAHGEVLDPSSSSLPVPSPSPSSEAAATTTQSPLLLHRDSFPPPPPPLPPSFISPLQRAATMPAFSIPRPQIKRSDPIIEEEVEEENEEDGDAGTLKRRSRARRGAPNGIPDEGFNDSGEQNKTKGGSSYWDYFTMENGAAAMDDDHEIESRRAEETESARVETSPPPPPQPAAAEPVIVKRVKQGGSGGGGGGSMKSTSNLSLLQIFLDLDDCFLRASESAHEVSRMLEATRLHYHSNFADKRGNINHSERVMRVITWNRSFKGLPNAAADNQLDDFDSEENETHASVLDKMLAWEKKLYDEVKAREQMKREYDKKVDSLGKLKKNGSNTEAVERMKAAVSHLHTRYIVDMQSMDSTVSEINRLRDEQLYPKLVALVDGMASMWETMRMHNEKQSKIVEALRLLDASNSPKETSDHHHDCTRQLGGVVQEWHTNFCDLMTHQKDYINALNSWLKLNLVHIDTHWKEKAPSPAQIRALPIQKLLNAWHDHLQKLPDEPAKAAINNFAAIIKTIWQHQKEELDFRNKCAEARKDLSKKTREFENWYNKYMHKRTPDEMDPDRVHDKDLVAERQLFVEAAQGKLKEDEEAYQRQCLQVRDKSLMSLKTHLPQLFRALRDFSLACSDMHTHLRSISQMK